MKGKVKFFNEKNSYGFITAEDEKDYFVHVSGLAPGVVLKDDLEVEFEVEDSDRGPKAVNVKQV